MHNPFIEVSTDDCPDSLLVERATNGDRQSLETLILRHQAWIYHIALRMTGHPHEAEEVTQEVLIKVITRLSTFQGASRFRTWLYRIVANHVLNMRRRTTEEHHLSFGQYGAAINDTPDLDLPDPKSLPVDISLLVDETRIGCTLGMLLCLERKQRLVFTLGAIFGCTDAVGGELLEMTAVNFRQLLTRARRDLGQFMNGQCGLVNPDNPCRCPKKTRGFVERGYVDPSRLLFAADHALRMGDMAADASRVVDDVLHDSDTVFRDHPFYEPPDAIQSLRRILDRPAIREALRLE